MPILNKDKAEAIRTAVDTLKNGPDTEERRKIARAAIECQLEDTKLEQYRISEVLIPLPVPETNGNSPTNWDGGNGGGSVASALPPIDTDAAEFVDGIIRTSSDSLLADAEDHWVLTYDPR
ncbi:hypothetical protein [Pseudomonas sp. Irchel 3A5]|uniref:hypothetical protein n=1 Tax=Pseudomonas sp. Irchel 3A5 TaxID=2008911 RepID=UPI000BA3169B|nr:hypothetical protein [Pseudomonas sp. Irchel 3A5]